MSRPQRWAVVGTGTISRSAVPDLMACEGVEVTIVHSRDPEKAAAFAAEFGIPRSTGDYAAVVADDSIDAIYLATPIATHHAMTRQALLAGRNVLVEKPIATSAAEAADLFALAADRGVFLMEAMWMKFNPVFRRLRQEIAEGRIGEPRSLRAGFGIPFPEDMGTRFEAGPGGGALLDQGIYPVTLAHALFGEPQSLHAGGVVRPDGVDLAHHVTLEFSQGRFAQCATSMTEFTDLSASVSGPKGWIVLSPPFWATTSLQVRAGSLEAIFVTPEAVDLPREGNGYVPMMREVVEAIEAGLTEHPVHTVADTLSVFRTLDEIRSQLTRTAAPSAGEDVAR